MTFDKINQPKMSVCRASTVATKCGLITFCVFHVHLTLIAQLLLTLPVKSHVIMCSCCHACVHLSTSDKHPTSAHASQYMFATLRASYLMKCSCVDVSYDAMYPVLMDKISRLKARKPCDRHHFQNIANMCTLHGPHGAALMTHEPGL